MPLLAKKFQLEDFWLKVSGEWLLSKKVSDKQTKKLFGYMTLIISFIIIIEQLIR